MDELKKLYEKCFECENEDGTYCDGCDICKKIRAAIEKEAAD